MPSAKLPLPAPVAHGVSVDGSDLSTLPELCYRCCRSEGQEWIWAQVGPWMCFCVGEREEGVCRGRILLSSTVSPGFDEICNFSLFF